MSASHRLGQTHLRSCARLTARIIYLAPKRRGQRESRAMKTKNAAQSHPPFETRAKKRSIIFSAGYGGRKQHIWRMFGSRRRTLDFERPPLGKATVVVKCLAEECGPQCSGVNHRARPQEPHGSLRLFAHTTMDGGTDSRKENLGRDLRELGCWVTLSPETRMPFKLFNCSTGNEGIRRMELVSLLQTLSERQYACPVHQAIITHK
jgi:hypothetical protein